MYAIVRTDLCHRESNTGPYDHLRRSIISCSDSVVIWVMVYLCMYTVHPHSPRLHLPNVPTLYQR